MMNVLEYKLLTVYTILYLNICEKGAAGVMDILNQK